MLNDDILDVTLQLAINFLADRTADANKTMGGRVCVYVNNNLCKATNISRKNSTQRQTFYHFF